MNFSPNFKSGFLICVKQTAEPLSYFAKNSLHDIIPFLTSTIANSQILCVFFVLRWLVLLLKPLICDEQTAEPLLHFARNFLHDIIPFLTSTIANILILCVFLSTDDPSTDCGRGAPERKDKKNKKDRKNRKNRENRKKRKDRILVSPVFLVTLVSPVTPVTPVILVLPHLLSFLTIGTCVFEKFCIFVMITLSF